MAQLRREVLKCFKELHRTRMYVFDGDERALDKARDKINEEFKKNKDIEDEAHIKEHLKLANDVIKELRETVIQLREKEPGVYEMRIRPEVTKLDNVPFDPNAKIPPPRSKKCN